MLLHPLGRSEQHRLFAVPDRVDDRAFRLPALLHELAKRARFLEKRRRAAHGIGRAVHPRVVMIAAHDPLIRERRARNFCADIRVEAFDVAGLLRLLWTSEVRSKRFVRGLLARMEQMEGLVIKNKESIFK